MAGAGSIKAGEAFVEVTIKDGMTQGLRRAQAKLAAFGAGVKMISSALTNVGGGLAAIGGALAATGGGITGIMAKSVQTFLEVSKFAKDTGVAIAGIDPSKAEKLSAAWKSLKATFSAIKFLIGSAIAEPVTRLIGALNVGAMSAARFVQNNAKLVVTIAAVGAVSLVAGTAIAFLGGTLVVAGAALSAIVAGFAALATPVGAITVALVAIGAATIAGAAAFVLFSTTAQNAIIGVAAALANGAILKAWEILLTGMTILWKTNILGWKVALLDILHVMDGAIDKMQSALGIKPTAFNAMFKGGLAGMDAGAAQDALEILALKKQLNAASAQQQNDFKRRASDSINQGQAAAVGSSLGTFSGRGASMIGVGPGGGTAVHDDAAKEKLEGILDVLKRLFDDAKGKAGPAFQ